MDFMGADVKVEGASDRYQLMYDDLTLFCMQKITRMTAQQRGKHESVNY